MHYSRRCLKNHCNRLSLVAFGMLALLAPLRQSYGQGNEQAAKSPPEQSTRRLLYVAAPGVRDLLEYGGHGVIVFDIDHGHRFVKRIPLEGLNEQGKPRNVKGVCACAATRRLYVSTTHELMCLDLVSDKLLWNRKYDGGCDRMAITADGKQIYLPSLEGAHWHVVDGATGDVIIKVVPDSGSHNTLCSLDGSQAFLAGLRSPLLTVVDTSSNAVVRTVGPFSASIRPFTVDGRGQRCYVNINELLGFEIGDLTTGKKLERVEVQGFKTGQVKRHGCPSHGIALTPDEREVWVTDASNQRLHVFDNTLMPPKQVASVLLRDEPGWVTFSIKGDFVYPSTGEVIDSRTRKIIATLKDEAGRDVQSEKMLELDFQGSMPIAAGSQFGVGRKSVDSKTPAAAAGN